MRIYIDDEFRCFAEPGAGRRAVETAAFDGKCWSYIDGFRFVPSGESWVRADGTVFFGEMISPTKPWEALERAQRDYEYGILEAQNAELVSTIAQLVEEIYEGDTEIIG